ncbi:hypothetical protein K488DRAFT_80732 [Vararia minispora EC-137]|uniref:Uncharacterized protein n=1 Tax=Vararia minispora EC-137 TaxID=1314806 RepID=A0ACB8Q987_9AGAM|nr:hypothetical protein K488DRAFT_80732 [Vararia minispora EC-137]
MIYPRTLIQTSRSFATTARVHRHRVLAYCEPGSPSAVIRAITHRSLPAPAPGTLNLRILLAPVNPSDINVIQGVYPSKPTASAFPGISSELFVAGNEGVAEICALGSGTDGKGLSVGDWVIIAKSQSGTWSSARNVHLRDVIKLPRKQGVTVVHAATMTVNPPTAYNMLNDFVDLKPGDWVVQNAANSAVGQAVIQIAKAKQLKTVNLIRDRLGNEAERTKRELKDLGADLVCTYSTLTDKTKLSELKGFLGNKPIRLALNCVGGEVTTHMLKLLGPNAHLVSYGAMSKQPLSIPTSYFIFKGLTARGFWQSQWYENRSRDERIALLEKLTDIVASGYLKEPKHEIITISAEDTDDVATQKAQQLLSEVETGSPGRKVLLHIEDPVV